MPRIVIDDGVTPGRPLWRSAITDPAVRAARVGVLGLAHGWVCAIGGSRDAVVSRPRAGRCGGAVAVTALERGGELRGYRLVEVVGEGAFAVVWRAEQPVLHREVAIKQIRSRLANEPEFIRRFEVEAQLVASLEHPYVVPLYDYWREPDAAYLVMRLLGGGTLESLLSRGPLDEVALRRLVSQVGAALRSAHRTGVVHRDVKPANVLLDTDGNFYLGDFGIAFSVDSDAAASVSAGSPAYASPEQLRGESVDARSDVYAFGLVLFEAATGELPYGDLSSHAAAVRAQLEEPVPPPSTLRLGVPAWVDEVVAGATAKDPSDRFGSIDALLDAVPAEGAIESGGGPRRAGVTLVGAALRNPFKALRAFGEADSGDFHGREGLVQRLVDVLARPGAAGRLLAVVGPSGSGKSSAVRAGLIPALRRGRVPNSERWFVTTMLPGRRPFEELEAALVRIAETAPGPLVELMTAGERGIARAVNQVLVDEDAELVVVIDQFEELFTHTVDDAERQRFLDGLVSAITEPRSRLRVVVTIRADFWDRPLAHPHLAPLVDAAAVTVTPLSPEELEHAIVEPVEAQGGHYEAGLVTRIVSDVAAQPGALPLLQYTLTELFDRNSAGMLTNAAYDDLGRITGSLAQRAEEIHGDLTEDQQRAAQRLFGRLVTLGDGTDDTRRRVLIQELGDDADTAACIDAFGSGRLLTFDRDPISRNPTVEIAHEALLGAWPRLRGWINDDRDNLRTLRALTAATDQWLAGGHDDGDLYRSGRLEAALDYRRSHPEALNTGEHQFLDRSEALRDHQAAQTQRTNRRLRRLVASVSVIAALAVAAGAIAFVQQQRAADERNKAEAATEEAETARSVAVAAESAERDARDAAVIRRMVADSSALRDRNPTVSMLLALEALERRQDPTTLGALLTSLQRDDGYLGFMPSTTVSDGGHWIGAMDDRTVVVRTRESVDVYDLVERRLVASTPLPSFRTGPFVWGATGGGRFGTITADFQLALIEPGGAVPEVFEAAGVATAVGFSEVGSMVVASGPVIRAFTGPGLAEERTFGNHGVAVIFAAMSRDGRYAATSDVNGTITLWDVEAGGALWSRTKWVPERWIEDRGTFELGGRASESAPTTFGLIEGVAPPPPEDALPEPLIGELQFSHDGGVLYAASAGIMAMDVETGAAQWQAPVPQYQLAELPDGRVLGGDRLIDNGVVTDHLDEVPPGARTAVTPDGSVVVALSNEGIGLWSGNGDQLIAEAVERGSHNFATMGADPDVVASYFVANGTSDDRLSGAVVDIHGVTLFDDNASKIAFTKTGDVVTTYGQPDVGGEQIIVRDPVTYQPIGPPLPVQRWGSIQVSADRRFVAVGYITGQFDGFVPVVHVYDVASAELIVSLTDGFDEGGGWGIFNMEFSPDGSMLAASDIGDVVVWDTGSWEVAHVFEPTADDSFLETAFTPDGSELAVASQRNGLIMFDLESGDRRSLAAGTVAPIGFNNINGLAITSDGRFAVVAGDGANLVDIESGTLIGAPFPTSTETQGASVGSAAVSLVTSTEEHLLLWDLSSDDWPEIACLAAGRNLTLDEWEQFGWPGEPYNATCDRWPDPS